MLSDDFETIRSLASGLAFDPIATTGIMPTNAFDDPLRNQATAFSRSGQGYRAPTNDAEPFVAYALTAAQHGLGESPDRPLAATDSHSRGSDESNTGSGWMPLVHAALERRSLAVGTYDVQVEDNESGISSTLSVLPTAVSTIATGHTPTDAFSLGVVSSPQTTSGFVGSITADNYYRLTLSATSSLNVALSNLTADADLQLIQDTNQSGIVDPGEVVGSSSNPGSQSESIVIGLAAGTYFINVHQYSGDTNYTLQTQATPIPIPVGYDTSYGYGLVDVGQAITILTGQNIPSPSLPSTNAWDLDLVDAPAVWAKGYTGQGIVVAVVDTGVDTNHSDLIDNLWTNAGEIPGNGIDDDKNGFVDDVHGWDFVDRDNMPTDSNGHGTHVAGTIAAEQNSFGITGVAYNAKIMPVRVLRDSGGSDKDVAAGIRYAVDNQARIINLSLGGSASSVIASAVQYANQKGALVVMAAGNDGGNQPTAPANLANQWGIAVGAIDRNQKLAAFSDRAGAVPLNYVVAPGVNILSTAPNNTYQSLSGTSMATPHVSGVAALVLSANPTLNPAQLTNLLIANASVQGLTV
ncbi:S8 family serine peptidase [Stenomitos frigidus]|uniref:Peptidase S8 n=1 Tax=Stenomitos frigidus ULC18 TaxID=2107698 RepID=A0A2T1ESH4_9CYAN|nr:S8 family serine peptidase [Stenomitos frigidus]PSB35685.1 peptidase S8 [Stenomitos frigidus ULC18]